MSVPFGWDFVGTECPDDQEEESEEIQDDDWTTSDGCKFYQNGKLILDCTDLSDKRSAVLAARIMKAQQFWPNVWYISDHGNVSPFTF